VQGEVSIAAETDTSLAMKKRHYGQHRKELSYGGFLESTSVQHSLSDSPVALERGEKDKEEGRVRKRIESEEEEGMAGKMVRGANKRQRDEKKIGMTDEELFEACGGRTAHK
jgi:hypothetical protein